MFVGAAHSPWVQRMSKHPVALGAIASVIAYLLVWLRWGPRGGQFDFGDLLIYQRGAVAVRHGGGLYETPVGERPFTYPVFAAFLFNPLSRLSRDDAVATFVIVSLIAYAIVLCISLRRSTLPYSVWGVMGALLFIQEPILRTFRLGQVNLFLMAMVLLDCFVAKRHRGYLVGVAAGIKLTPGIFVLYFALRRDWGAVLRAGAGLLFTIAVSAAIDPRDTWKYWTQLFFSPSTIGGYAYVDNQSLYGVAVRVLQTEHPATWLTTGLFGCSVLIGALTCRTLLARGNDLAALTALGIGGLLASPVSWSHHWVWLTPACIALMAAKKHISAAVIWLLAYAAPWWWTPYGGLKEFHHHWWQALLCATLIFAAIVYLTGILSSEGQVETIVTERTSENDILL